MKDKECPRCGNVKHHEIISVDTEDDTSDIFTCKACGYKELGFKYKDDKEAVERMGDAFRDFLKHGKKKVVKKE